MVNNHTRRGFLSIAGTAGLGPVALSKSSLAASPVEPTDYITVPQNLFDKSPSMQRVVDDSEMVYTRRDGDTIQIRFDPIVVKKQYLQDNQWEGNRNIIQEIRESNTTRESERRANLALQRAKAEASLSQLESMPVSKMTEAAQKSLIEQKQSLKSRLDLPFQQQAKQLRAD